MVALRLQAIQFAAQQLTHITHLQPGQRIRQDDRDAEGFGILSQYQIADHYTPQTVDEGNSFSMTLFGVTTPRRLQFMVPVKDYVTLDAKPPLPRHVAEVKEALIITDLNGEILDSQMTEMD